MTGPVPRSTSFGPLTIALLSLLLYSTGCAGRPQLLEERPVQGAVFNGNTVRFTWTVDAPGGEELVGYRLQVAPTVRFASPVHDQVYRERQAEVILPAGTFYWRVQGQYRRLDDTLATTEWSDMKLVDGRYLQQARSLVVQEPGGGATLASGGLPEAPPAPQAGRPPVAGGGPPASGLRPGRPESVVPAHDTRPALDGIDTLGVATVLVDGKEDVALTRELILRLFQVGRYTLLEQQLVPGGELRLPLDFLDAAGRPKEPSAERSRSYLLHGSQLTPMIADETVRLKSPDAMLVVRIARLAYDPSLLPRRPAPPTAPRPDFARFESGTRVLNATLISVKSGVIRWTASLYGLPDIADMALVSGLVDSYFR